MLCHESNEHPKACSRGSRYSLHKLSAALLRIVESLLDEPPLGHFIANGRLRTFVYQVKSVQVIASGEVRKRLYKYLVKADSLEPLTVVTAYQFPDTQSTARSLSIGSLWDDSEEDA